MKNNHISMTALITGLFILLLSCTDDFKNHNNQKTGYTPEEQEYDFNKYRIQFDIIQQGIYFNYDWGGGKNWPFQVMQNLTCDMFCGYFHDYQGKFNGRNSTYNLDNGWTSSNWDITYGYILPAVIRSETNTLENNYPGYYGITKIMKVELMHRITDQYGPIIYSHFGSKTGSSPDTQKEAYYHFFTDLDQGIDNIRKFVAENPNFETFQKIDKLTQKGTYAAWIKFANSLRLRLAMRIANVDKAKAQEEVTKAMKDGGGFIETNDDNIAVLTEKGYSNPLGEIVKAWGEVLMNANLESYLVGYNDPRLSVYFDKAAGNKANPSIKDTYRGVRQGTGTTHDNYNGCSKSTISQSSDAILMTAAEVWLLRAEAALREMTTEAAGICYQKGIEISFAQWNVSGVGTYILSEKTPADYKDVLDGRFDAKAQSTVTPKWDETATKEEKLEKIAVQRWIACYPEGAEAWAIQRCTGYPKLFPVVINNSEGTIDTETGIRRLFFNQDLKNNNPEQYRQLFEALKGPDTGGTRLWWDVGENKF